MEITDSSIVDGLEREKNEEVGKDFKVLVDVDASKNIYFTKNDGQKMILPHYAAIFKGGSVNLSNEYSEYAWIKLLDLKQLEPKVETIPICVDWALEVLKTVTKTKLIEI
jgi:hypothetical protein